MKTTKELEVFSQENHKLDGWLNGDFIRKSELLASAADDLKKVLTRKEDLRPYIEDRKIRNAAFETEWYSLHGQIDYIVEKFNLEKELEKFYEIVEGDLK